VRKPLIYIASLLFIIALILSGCGNRSLLSSNKHASNVEDSVVQRVIAVPLTLQGEGEYYATT
jgi:hypothetical protein